jgi:hypothetical protein
MVSIYHFFANLVTNKNLLSNQVNLHTFPFDKHLFEYEESNEFDYKILKSNSGEYQGGEVVKLIECSSFDTLSFGFTVPRAQLNLCAYPSICRQLAIIGNKWERLVPKSCTRYLLFDSW